MDHAGEPSTAGGARRPSLPSETFPTSVSVSSKPSLRTGNCPSCTDSKTARLWGMSGKRLQETGSSRPAFCKNRARVPTKAAAGCRSSGRSSRANAELQTGKSQGCTTSFNIMPLCLRLKWTAASGRPCTEAKEAREHGNLRRIRGSSCAPTTTALPQLTMSSRHCFLARAASSHEDSRASVATLCG
jgi:hypothetical protein